MLTTVEISSSQNNSISENQSQQQFSATPTKKESSLPYLWVSDFLVTELPNAKPLRNCFSGIYSPNTPPGELKGHHILALDPDTPEREWREIAYSLMSAGCKVSIKEVGGFTKQPLEWWFKETPLNDLLYELTFQHISFSEWEDSRDDHPLKLKEALELAEVVLVGLGEGQEANIALDALRRRANVSEFKWNKEYLVEIRARLEKTLGLPAQPPNIQELTESEIRKLIAELIDKGVAGAELREALNQISHFTRWRIDQLYKLHEQQLEDIERVESRDDTREQLESLLSASNASLDLHQFLHPNLAKPLLHLASRLSLKPEVYLTVLLTVASSLHHPKTRIWLSEEVDFNQPPNLPSAIVAPSSQKKSPIIKALATEPLKVLQAEARNAYQEKLKAYQYALEEWEALPKEKKREVDPPVKPERAVYYFTKTTGEGLEYQAARQPDQGMLYLSDELPAIINNQNKYTNGKGSDRQDLLSYYDGTGHVTLRADGIKSELDDILLSILGGVQPKVLQALLNNCEDSDGNWARFIFVNQPEVAGRLHPDGGRIDLKGLLVDLYRKIRALPITEYTLSPEAFKVFEQAYNRYEQNRVKDALEGMKAVWGKSEGRAGRLALNLHVINSLANGEIPSGVIDVETMRKAITLTDYYASQVKALYTEFSDSDAMAPHLAKVIEMSLKAIQSQSKGWLKASEVCRSITKAKRPTGETVRLWFTELVTLGKGEVMGSGRSLLFRAFCPENPPSEKIDKNRQKIDKPSIAEVTAYQALQEKIDKIDKIDDFQKNLIEAKKHEEVGLTTELVKKSLLGESSILSPNCQSDQPVKNTAIDNSSTDSSIFDKSSILPTVGQAVPPAVVIAGDGSVDKTSIFDKPPISSTFDESSILSTNPHNDQPAIDVAIDNLSTESSILAESSILEAITLTSPTEIPSQLQSELPIYQRLDGNYEIQEIDKVDTQIDNSSIAELTTDTEAAHKEGSGQIMWATTFINPSANYGEQQKQEEVEAPVQSPLPISQRLDDNYEVQETKIDKVDERIDDSSSTPVITQDVVSVTVNDEEWQVGDQIVVDASDLPPTLKRFDGMRGSVELVKETSSQCLINFGAESMHIQFRGLRKVNE